MKQLIRNNTFETNSSSIHSIAIMKSDRNLDLFGMEEHIPIILDECDFQGYTHDPARLLSYLYTLSLVAHDWNLLDKIKEEFPACIFQKPSWDLPYKSKTGFCDDREVISFCDLVNGDIPVRFDSEQMVEIRNNLKDIVANGELYIGVDISYISALEYIHEEAGHTKEEHEAWINEHIKKLIIGY